MFDQVFERLRTIVCEQLEIAPEAFTEDAAFIQDLGADSLDVIDLAMRVEEEFRMQIPDDDYVNFATVKQAVEYIAAHAENADSVQGSAATESLTSE